VSYLAVNPVGYAGGYSQALGARARTLIGSYSAPIIGRVCMKILMADVTGIPGVSIGDEFLTRSPPSLRHPVR